MLDLLVSLPFIDIPTPAAPPGSEKILLVLSWLFWGAGIAGIIGFVVLGIRLFLDHQNGRGGPEAGKNLAYIFGGLVLIGAAGGLVTTFLGI